jgi:ADP-heptose:LPS heptosyltransferase
MQSFGNIVVFHPAAIGDAMLATPVATTLKLNFPAAKITYWTHPSLRPILLGLCPAIDEVFDYVREASLFQQVKHLKELQPDLFVDLANSTKSRTFTWLAKTKIVRYQKQSPNETPMKHAVANFLDTIRPICDEFPDPLFPTIFPEALASEILQRLFMQGQLPSQPLIGIVPGVGKLRPHRAWIFDGWSYLLQHILSWNTYLPILIGGPEEEDLCRQLNESVSNRCLNVAGKLSLPETAAFLKRCRVVVSGDTGPAHIAVAVGTPVIGLYGPTYPARSGPYGCLDTVIDQSSSCQCHNSKTCNFAAPGEPGECMRRIMLEEITHRLKMELEGQPLHL